MHITVISDTHNRHRFLNLPLVTDVIVHAGDFSNVGKPGVIEDFLDWFGGLPHPHKILIGGNHDFLLEGQPRLFQNMLPDGITYLEENGVTINGLNFWGSPITPYFYMQWAFNRFRGNDIGRHWQKIPDNTDILITHGPPRGIGDTTVSGASAGCDQLMERIQEIQPRYHFFGHIHEGYGVYQNDHTVFVNASVVDEHLYLVNDPVVVELS